MAKEPTQGGARGAQGSSKRTELPPRAAFALEDMQRICAAMFELDISPSGHPTTFSPDNMDFGAYLSLIGESGSWEIALFGDDLGCSGLARVIYAMEGDQTPSPDEIVDAMGELVNMVSGAVKKRLDQQEHERLTIGVPMFHISHEDCEKYRTRVIPLISQRLESPKFAGGLYLVWSERTPVVLLREALSTIESPNDKLALGSGLAALHELWEIVSERTATENASAILVCQSMLTDLINDSGSPSIAYIGRVIEALIAVLSEDWLIPLQLPEWAPQQQEAGEDDDAPQTEVARDAELVEMVREFISESVDGLEKCDEILMQFEHGPVSSDGIAALFRQFHTIKGVSSFYELSDIEHLAHSTENLLAAARDGKRVFEGTAVDLVFEATSLMSRLIVKVRDAVDRNLSFPASKSARALREKIEAFLRGEVIETVASRLATPEENVATEETPGKALPTESVKVDVEHLIEFDVLISQFDVVLHQLANPPDPAAALLASYDSLVELRRQAQSLSTRMRMVPLRALFQKMTRMVRDLSKKTEKLARLVLAGEDIRVERSIAEKLNAPLVHMLRNSIDHGLEDGEQRRAAGKALIGQIRLSAERRSDCIIIEIADDGKGLDAEAIWQKAIKKGLVDSSHRPSDSELYFLIFEAGFSTAAAVTAISGRGVGMDVVRREIEALHGRIDIESSKGKGCLFRITLPVTN